MIDERGTLRGSATIDAATLDTGNALRDRRLRGGEFFDTERLPEVRFASCRIDQVGGDGLRITGDLTIKDTTRQIELHGLAVSALDERLDFLITGTLSRTAFGIDSLQLKAAGVSDAVTIVATLSFSRAAGM